MSGSVNNAGMLPAFVDYARLGAGYAQLLSQVRNHHTVHAYLLVGPRGVGKATFARYLAATLFCTESNAPCGGCEACRRVFSGAEPDVVELFSQDDKVIPIDRVREAIGVISQHAYGGGTRVVLVEPAEKLTPQAQNCLLKSLEDPPAQVLFLLMAHETSAVLGTIASRCATIKLPPWPDEALRNALTQRGVESAKIDALLPRAGGNMGLALELLQDEAGESDLQALILSVLRARRDADVVALSTRLKDDRDGAERALRSLEQALHQALLARTGVMPAETLREETLRTWAAQADALQLAELLYAVSETRKRRQSQVNWQASIDRLLMKIVEAKTEWQPS